MTRTKLVPTFGCLATSTTNYRLIRFLWCYSTQNPWKYLTFKQMSCYFWSRPQTITCETNVGFGKWMGLSKAFCFVTTLLYPLVTHDVVSVPASSRTGKIKFSVELLPSAAQHKCVLAWKALVIWWKVFVSCHPAPFLEGRWLALHICFFSSTSTSVLLRNTTHKMNGRNFYDLFVLRESLEFFFWVSRTIDVEFRVKNLQNWATFDGELIWKFTVICI